LPRLCRDVRARPEPLRRCKRAHERSPLGAAALAGTSYPIDREATAKGARLRAADAQFARCRRVARFRARLSGGGTIAATHLSRLAEEIVLWMSPSFGFVKR
jgi:argininosuccinate lyase